MSSKATAWALEQPLPPTTKVVLWGYAEHAHPDGTCSWISVTKAAQYAGVSKATAVAHVQKLIEGGWIRPGNQALISSDIPTNRRPVLYDLAMDEETRQVWAAEYDPATDPRQAARAGGAKGGAASAAKRAQGLEISTPTDDGSGVQSDSDQGFDFTNVRGSNFEPKPRTEPTTKPLVDFVSPHSPSLVPDSGPKARQTSPRKAAARPLSADWKPTRDHHTFATQRGLDLPTEVMAFRAHAEANDRRQVRWDASFTQWLIHATKFSRTSQVETARAKTWTSPPPEPVGPACGECSRPGGRHFTSCSRWEEGA